MPYHSILKLLVFILITEMVQSGDDWSICVPQCKCKWVSGKKSADCPNAGLTSIPSGLKPEIQQLDLSGNSITRIGREAFKSVGLINLQRIHLRECHIQEVHVDAFFGLQVLIELDLSYNRIHVLHPGTFRDTYRLRVLNINKNPIKRLGDGLFTNLGFLQAVDVSNCELSHISDKTFYNVSNPFTIKLDGNNLTRMKLSVVKNLKLKGLQLHNNPWRCDCHLKPFRDWVIERNLYSQPTSCSEPQSLENKYWTDVPPEAFACKPTITYPITGTTVVADSDEVTLSCRVTGDPMPEVHWVFNTRIITNNSRTKYGDLRYTIRSSTETNRWVNLTVNRVRPSDRGEFTCVAQSLGGVDEKNITLIVSQYGGGIMGSANTTDSWPLIIGLTTGMLALLIIVIILCYCFCRKRDMIPGKKSPVNGVSPNGDIITHHIGSSAEQEKSLLAVNPVQKPPRLYEAQGSPTSGAELSELNRKLLDDSAAIAPSLNDEDRSVDSVEATPQRSRDKLDPEAFPPDLIAFPGRAQNASPASSSASTALEPHGRSLHRNYPSPLHSPVYNGFGTLPYSRSQSPFSPTTPIILPRQGYVTIPRRPRIPSWSSAPTPTPMDDPLSPLKPKPVFYDNLGPRTTADGSILSLNKAGSETPKWRNNTLPAYSPYDDKESEERKFWTNRTVDIGSLKRTNSADIPIENMTRPKVAPKPPPKPKKNNGPLYEDEGEDGTEV